MTNKDTKRTNGQFFTAANPFDCRPFSAWAKRAGLPDEVVLEPFAGANSLIDHLQSIGKINNWKSFDIEPQASGIVQQDTIAKFPRGYKVCVTNPPWLAKNSAAFRGLPFPETEFDDLYKLALTRCLDNCDYVAALIPESFIRANLHQERLHTFISLTKSMFNDTQHPVGLALFDSKPTDDVIIYSGKQRIALLSEIKRFRPASSTESGIRFNAPDGNVGLIALDNTREASIRFCDVKELKHYEVSDKCRHITKVHVPGSVKEKDWNHWNGIINRFRHNTHDVLLTCYRGIRQDGMYRRRLDWNLARDIIGHA